MSSTVQDWNDLRYFLAVARGGGLSAAGAALGSSASTVSRHIDSLEARLGVRLFLRQQRGYLLTDQGSTLFAHVTEVERAMHAVERSGGVGDEVAGLVKLSASESLANYLISPRLHEFSRRHPRIRVELVVSRNIADLSQREADLALRMVNPAHPDHNPDYIGHRLGLLGFGLYASPTLLAAHADWRQLPYVAWEESWVKLPMAEWLAQLFPHREPLLRTNTFHTQLTAARSGLCAILLPCFVGDGDPGLQRVAAAELDAVRELWVLYHRDLKGSQRVLAMRDFLLELARRHLGAALVAEAGL